MNLSAVEKIANAVLYEGYVLYPYRASAVKNQQRFNFGVLYPRRYCERNPGSDNWQMQTECMVAEEAPAIEAKVRFLQMITRPNSTKDWQEGVERDVSVVVRGPERILMPFSFGHRLEGEIEAEASKLEDGLHKITLRVRNCSTITEQEAGNRDLALLRSLVSVHCILHVEGGQFISAIDPPGSLQAAAAQCHNIGTWPVLVGEEGQTDLMLSSPIILYDYPQIAAESPGDLCDGLEIDEILALRILTLTEEEKREVREGDERARHILERTELLPPEQFQKLHGALRGLREPSENAR